MLIIYHSNGNQKNAFGELFDTFPGHLPRSLNDLKGGVTNIVHHVTRFEIDEPTGPIPFIPEDAHFGHAGARFTGMRITASGERYEEVLHAYEQIRTKLMQYTHAVAAKEYFQV